MNKTGTVVFIAGTIIIITLLVIVVYNQQQMIKVMAENTRANIFRATDNQTAINPAGTIERTAIGFKLPEKDNG